jgi:hypothetical protein
MNHNGRHILRAATNLATRIGRALVEKEGYRINFVLDSLQRLRSQFSVKKVNRLHNSIRKEAFLSKGYNEISLPLIQNIWDRLVLNGEF